MSKYLTLIQLHIIKATEHRSEMVVWIILSIIPHVILLLIWQSVYGPAQVLRGYTLPSLLQYFLLGSLINGITATHFENWRAREIREGKIDHYMTKPISYPIRVLLADVGSKFFYTCLLLPGFLCSYAILKTMFPLASLHLSLPIFLQCALLFIFGYLIEFSLALISVLLVFWFEGADGLEHFKWMIVSLLSGWMIPIAFMPKWLANMVTTLPVKYMYAVPIEVFLGRQTLEMNDYAYMFATLFVLWAGLHILWKRAVLQYTSAGG